ncbi:MAG: hypothetical protein U1E89_04615 [Burkholderiaceae bacterium]
MFNLALSPAYWWPVKVRTPAGGDAAGQLNEGEFEVEFNRLGEKAFAQFIREITEKKLSDVQIVPRVLRNFRKVQDESGASLPYSNDNLGTLLDVPGAATAIVAAFFESRSPAAEKN